MENDLIKRYIYAVTRHLPQKMRPEVERELDSLIADMLSARCRDIQPTDRDIRVVLTELGPPEELASKYIGDENKALISGINFLYYKQILKIVLPIVVVCVTIGTIINAIVTWDPEMNPFAQFGLSAGQVFLGILGGLVIPFAIITIIFAVFERYQVKLDDGDMFSRLPEVPTGSEKIKPAEAVAAMIFSVIVVVVLLGFPEIVGIWTRDTGWVPIFLPAVLRGLWMIIVLWAALEILKESVKIIEGQYTKRLAILTIVCNVIVMATAAHVFLNVKVVNPEFLNTLKTLISDADGQAAATGIFGNINYIIIGALLIGLVVDSIVVAVNAYKNEKKI